MAEENKTNKTETTVEQKKEDSKVATTQSKDAKASSASDDSRPARGGRRRKGRGDKRKGRRRNREDDEFDSRIINVRRVSRMYKGGRRMRLSVFVVVGDKKGRVGAGLGKGADVGEARRKAIAKAKKNLVMVPLKGNTIPHDVFNKFKSSRVMVKPAAPGTGIIAGGTVKAVLELAGIQDALTKVLASNNQINVAYATIDGLKTLRAHRI